jgi:two-component system alkaline phosphatase synthesis response regulator PhoP
VSRPGRKVLIVEDDEAMATALRDGFTYEGFEVAVAKDGARGLQLALEGPTELVILDVMLPRMSGLDVCRRIRASRPDLPVIMLTARGQEIDKVLGLKAGADDYVTKPFSFMELMARVEAVLRRAGAAGPAASEVRFGDVAVDFVKCEATKAGRPVELSALELRLLQFFVEHRGEVLGRDQLLGAVWGYESSLSRTVDVHVAKLRRKLEDRPESPRFLLTIHGLGYKFTG